jgi:hypothetical protein
MDTAAKPPLLKSSPKNRQREALVSALSD